MSFLLHSTTKTKSWSQPTAEACRVKDMAATIFGNNLPQTQIDQKSLIDSVSQPSSEADLSSSPLSPPNPSYQHLVFEPLEWPPYPASQLPLLLPCPHIARMT